MAEARAINKKLKMDACWTERTRFQVLERTPKCGTTVPYRLNAKEHIKAIVPRSDILMFGKID